jgi:hypothetical protein
MDGDRDIDLLVTYSSGSSSVLYWYENDGVQNFQAHHLPYPGGWKSNAFAADMDTDGDMDIVSQSIDGIVVNENDGDQNFTPRLLSIALYDAQLSAADADSDGDIDIEFVDYLLGIGWCENGGDGTFVQHMITNEPAYDRRIITTDLDSDGDLDLVLGSSYTDEIPWYENDGDGNFIAHSIYVPIVTLASSDVFPADIDGDGDVDLATASDFTGNISWYENDGGQNFAAHWLRRLTGYQAHAVDVADMDGDGDLDVLSGSDDGVRWYENSESSGLDYGDAPAPYPTLAAENGAVHVATGPMLGVARDTEFDGTHSEAAYSGYWEEDGVHLPAVQVGQLGVTTFVRVQGGPAKLDAWVDFNANGNWGDPGEQIADSVPMAVGNNVLSFDVPSWAVSGTTYARFRLSTAGDLSVTGFAADGEVEDYAVTIVLPPPVIDLNGPAGGTGFINSAAHWTGSGGLRAPEDTASARITDTLGNPYATNLASMTATIGTADSPSGGVHQGDILTATTLVGGITQSYNAITGVLTLSGNATSANYQTVLRSIRYDNSSTFGGPGADTVHVYFVGVDESNFQSESAQGQILVDPKEDVDLDGAGGNSDFATTWNNTGPVNVSDSDATVKDGQRAYLTSMTVTIGNPSAGDALSAVVTGTNIDVQGIGSTQLLFNAKPPLNTDELVNWQTVLRTIQYFNTLGGPGIQQVFIEFDYTDGFGGIGVMRETTVNIDVPPILDLNGPTAGAGFTSSWLPGSPVSITDAVAATVVDGQSPNLTSLTATIVGVHAGDVLSANTAGTSISRSYNAGTGVLTLSGVDTADHYQAVLRTVKYDNTSGAQNGPLKVNFVGTDAEGSSEIAVATVIAEGLTTIASPRLFYNQSGTATRYDGNNLAINSLDDLAIATDKTAYRWEDAGAATFANVSSYTKGINGIMVDIAGPHGAITAADFIFKVGNNNSPGLWGTANTPTSVSVRAGAGVSGSDRVEIIWNTGAPIKQWLEVIVKANVNTGLPQAAGYPAGQAGAFFFGSAVGDSGLGDTAVNATVNATDESGARNNPATLAANIPITNIYDFDRNAQVNANDQNFSRLNATNVTTVLKYINLTTAPAAPEADVFAGDEDIAGDGGVASALTASAPTSGEVNIPGWLANRLDSIDLSSIDLNTGIPAKVFQYLHDVNTQGTRALFQKFDAVADALGLDDELLDELLADLK